VEGITAVGFDLFNTLIIAEPGALDEALKRLVKGLEQYGIFPDPVPFQQAYREAAVRHITEANHNGIETHNRFWISEALQRLGYAIEPEDARISSAVESYFSAFLDFCHVIPDALPMLRDFKAGYRLGLLSNFTHAPAALKLIQHLGLDGFFDVVLISGEIGYRKPHYRVFEELLHGLGVSRAELLYVGDDPEADVRGALNVGIQPVWFTYARDKGAPLPPGATSDPAEMPHPDIPMISDWGKFAALLDR